MQKNGLTLDISEKNKKMEKANKKMASEAKIKLRKTNKRYFFAKVKYFISSSANRLKVDIEDMVEEREIKKIFEQNCKNTYSEYLDLANATAGKTGVENFENELGKGKVVYTENGPFLRIDIDAKKSQSKKPEILYEGFMPNQNGTISYNYVTLFPVEFSSKFAFARKPYYNAEGFKFDPHSQKIERVLKFEQASINPYEFYFNSIENKSKNSQNNSAKNSQTKNNIIEFKQKSSKDEIGFSL